MPKPHGYIDWHLFLESEIWMINLVKSGINMKLVHPCLQRSRVFRICCIMLTTGAQVLGSQWKLSNRVMFNILVHFGNKCCLGIECVENKIQRARLKWFGHVERLERKEENQLGEEMHKDECDRSGRQKCSKENVELC